MKARRSARSRCRAEGELPQLPLLFQRPAQDRQHGAILFTAQLFLECDERFKIENADAKAFGNSQLDGMRKQFLVAKIPADGTKQVERAIPRDQIQMAGGSERTCARYYVQVFENGQKSSDIRSIAGVDNVNVESVDGSAVQDGSDAANHDEIHIGMVEGTQSDDRLRIWH